MIPLLPFFIFFFFNDTATTEIYTLSLHDALPISLAGIPLKETEAVLAAPLRPSSFRDEEGRNGAAKTDRKSTRLNSSHSQISYAVFCLKKKNHITVTP